jgi:hypothetical protein
MRVNWHAFSCVQVLACQNVKNLTKNLYQEYTLVTVRQGEREKSPGNSTCQLTCILLCATYCVSNVKNLIKSSVKDTHWWRRRWEREINRQLNSRFWHWARGGWLASELRLRLRQLRKRLATAMARILVMGGSRGSQMLEMRRWSQSLANLKAMCVELCTLAWSTLQDAVVARQAPSLPPSNPTRAPQSYLHRPGPSTSSVGLLVYCIVSAL